MPHESPVTGSLSEGAPDTTDPVALAKFCTKWRLDPGDGSVVAFLDLCLRDGTRWENWAAAWRTWRRAAPVPVVEPDGLDDLDAMALVKEGIDELGMAETHKIIGLAEATTARLAARVPVIGMTITVATLRAPALRERIRRARREAQAKAAEPDEGIAAKTSTTRSAT
jgi:hypothetical protein